MAMVGAAEPAVASDHEDELAAEEEAVAARMRALRRKRLEINKRKADEMEQHQREAEGKDQRNLCKLLIVIAREEKVSAGPGRDRSGARYRWRNLRTCKYWGV